MRLLKNFFESTGYIFQKSRLIIKVLLLRPHNRGCKLQAASCKLQAASCKLQAASCKLQAASLRLEA